MEKVDFALEEETREQEHHATALRPGQVLHERYQILRILGTGGMSAVYEARDLNFPNVVRLCAVKEIIADPTPSAEQARQYAAFEREVNLLASLSHPAIPKIYEYFNQDHRSYLVLELVRGQDLDTFLRQSAEPLPERTVVRWAIEICEVLHYLHSCLTVPIIFRDMKPSNVMLNEHGHIVLIDFGIAKLFRIDRRGTMIGTEGYSPPEQYRGEASPQCDIYALGATMHHLLTATDPTKEAPFSFHERPLGHYNPTVSPEVAAVVERALAYDPEDRFASIAEMRQALEETQQRGTLSLSAPARLTEQPVEVRWSFECEDEIRSSPRIGLDSIYIGSYDNNLYALNLETGELRWKYPTESGIAATPLPWEGLILIGSEDFSMHAVSASTGLVNWVRQTKGRIRSTARVAYEHLFFGSDDGNIYGLQARTGRVVWKSPTGGPVRSTPAIGDEMLYVGCEDGYVYAVDLRRGNLRWRHHCGGGVTSSPLLWEGALIAGSADGHVYALDLNSGWPVWRYKTEGAIISSPAVWEGTVYIGSSDGCLYALEATAGRLRWKMETDGQVNSSPAVTADAVYVGSADGCLYSVSRSTGKPYWKFKTDGPIVSSPIEHGGIVYVGSLDGNLYALCA